METADFGFVQPWSTPKRPIYDEQRPLQTPQAAAHTSLTFNLYRKEFDTIEMNTKHEPKLNVNATNSGMEILKLFRL